ncbi:MAG: LCP family protein [Candidatus Gracilibacteria bacterium]|nr:LCP family protein [Candidatus Gracilibacteria bacterium]MDD5179448.1 LCP family protein [Candidatus Gracilibacteria bacterium]
MFQKAATAIRWTLVTIGIFLVFQMVSGVFAWVSGGSITDLVWLLAGDLAQDTQKDTNFLIMGIGGRDHSGADLTDVFMVASYNHDLKTLTMLSIPRDFYTEASDRLGMRVNRIYDHEKEKTGDSKVALEAAAEVASRITNVPIHYYIKLDFEAFKDMVDALGGVKVTVTDKIDDPYFPCDNLIDYCPFKILPGFYNMDGKTALKYSRSRETTSDFDRAARQQKVIEAIREKALEEGILTNPKKLRDLYGIFEERVETNLQWREILALGKIANEFNKQNLAQFVLNNEKNQTGGLLYSPNREDYGGASVLIPQGENLNNIHLFTQVLFNHPRVAIDQIPIEVLNASGRSGIAEKVAYDLNRYALNTEKINNYPGEDIPHTKIFYYDAATATETLGVLRNFIDVIPEVGPVELQQRGFGITIVLGEDWKDIEKKMPGKFQ